MSGYDELHYRCLSSIEKHDAGLISRGGAVSQILAEVFLALETVTPEMHDEANLVWKFGSPEVWLAMLHASPLAKPKENAP